MNYTDLNQKMFLMDTVISLKENYGMCPEYLYSWLQDCMQNEMRILANLEQGGSSGLVQESLEIKSELDEINQLVNVNADGTKQLHSIYENFFLLLNNLSSLALKCQKNPRNEQLHAEKARIETMKQQRLVVIVKRRIELVEQLSLVIQRTQKVQNIVLGKHLENWKYVQSKGTGIDQKQQLVSLDTIQGE